MVLAARLSARLGNLDDRDVARVENLLSRARLPIEAPALGVARYLDLMAHDKKVQEGQIRLVLLKSLGQAFVTADYPPRELREVLAGAAAHA
jgi:3-dehydroquinate synthase